MTSAWELLSSERQGQVGRRVLTAKTFRLPDGSEKTFTVTEHTAGTAAAVIALTVRGTVVLAEQYRPGPERVMAELPGGGIDPDESGEFVTIREVTPGDLLALALAGAMTDAGGVLLALPYLTGDPQVRALLANPAG